eukprot:TRINITY_DN920_c0_g2_i2.p1 TRINITY_DN920_c0_g2~~TRINITY_DN920_c0_g2_i2.p1  ORF type:complete len:329 (+),score=84.58 TRINITY_DN920_c0_g2_i2:116-1102(+)
MSRLDKDIDDFYRWMKLESKKLRLQREKIKHEILAQLHRIDPQLEISVYGSYSVDLSLPTSDIDIIIVFTQRIFRNTPQAILQRLVEVIKHEKYIAGTKIISNSSMPVLRIECNEEMAGVKLDITVSDNRHKGIECVEMTRRMIEIFPAFERLTLLLKYILRISDLNDPYHGGLSSYGMMLLLIAYFENFCKEVKDMRVSEILLDVLNFYGNFNFATTFVAARYPWDPSRRECVFRSADTEFDVPMVIDPLVTATTNNVTKSTGFMNYIKKMFRVASKSVYHHCSCISHKIDGYENKEESLSDHCLLADLFAAVLPFKNNPYRKLGVL